MRNTKISLIAKIWEITSMSTNSRSHTHAHTHAHTHTHTHILTIKKSKGMTSRKFRIVVTLWGEGGKGM